VVIVHSCYQSLWILFCFNSTCPKRPPSSTLKLLQSSVRNDCHITKPTQFLKLTAKFKPADNTLLFQTCSLFDLLHNILPVFPSGLWQLLWYPLLHANIRHWGLLRTLSPYSLPLRNCPLRYNRHISASRLPHPCYHGHFSPLTYLKSTVRLLIPTPCSASSMFFIPDICANTGMILTHASHRYHYFSVFTIKATWKVFPQWLCPTTILFLLHSSRGFLVLVCLLYNALQSPI
jgi:hypothetical protein